MNKLHYYKELDGVRAIAALMIMYFHFMFELYPEPNTILFLLKKISVFGQTGVTLFFVLSGFLITRILINSKSESGYFKNFYIRRSLRIFPLYYFFLILYYGILIPLVYNKSLEIQSTWPYWIYMQNVARTFSWESTGPTHFWSLAVEEHFYLFWPLVVYFCSTKRLLQVIGVIILFALFCRIVLINEGYLYGTNFFTFTQIDCLAIGSILALNEIKQWISFRTIVISGSALITLLIVAWIFWGGEALTLVQYLKLPIIATFYLGLIGTLISGKTFLNRVFENKFLQYSGKISYGLYVYHPACFYIIFQYTNLNNLFFEFVLSFVLSYVIASLSYYAFEVKFIKMKKSFENKTLKMESVVDGNDLN